MNLLVSAIPGFWRIFTIFFVSKIESCLNVYNQKNQFPSHGKTALPDFFLMEFCLSFFTKKIHASRSDRHQVTRIKNEKSCKICRTRLGVYDYGYTQARKK